MKVRMMKNAPRSTGLALGRLWSLTHILFKRPSASSLASILIRDEEESLTVRQLRGISLLPAVSSGSDTQAVRMSPFTHYSREIYMKMWDEGEHKGACFLG